MTWTWRDIPVTHASTGVELLHPVVAARIAALCNDPRMQGKLRVVSAVRTQAEQIYLWDCYQAKLRTGRCPCASCNTAANPYATSPGAYGLPSRQGSWHMAQSNGRGYACDMNHSQLPSALQAEFVRLLPAYRLEQTVQSPQFEPWHLQPPLDENPLVWVPPDPRDEDVMSPEQEAKLDAIASELKATRAEVHDLREQVSLGTKPPARTVQAAVGAIARKLGV